MNCGLYRLRCKLRSILSSAALPCPALLSTGGIEQWHRRVAHRHSMQPYGSNNSGLLRNSH